MIRLINTFLMLILLSACGSGTDNSQDWGSVDGASLLNQDFNGNAVEFVAGMNGCLSLTAQDMAKLYDTTVERAMVVDLTKENVGNVDPRTPPSCTLRIQASADDRDTLTGSMILRREVAVDEAMGDLAQAMGSGEEWQEEWALQKQIRNLESVPNLGMAALWNQKTRRLSIKFDGYSADITAPGSAFNQVEQERQRDYRNIAVQMAKLSGLSD
jgi:hypothetical protein